MSSRSFDITIDPELRPGAMAAAFARFGRIHIPGFLSAPAAQTLHAALDAERSWMCSTLGGGVTVDVPVEHLEAMTPDQTAAFLSLAHAEAGRGFHYMFDNLRISDAVEKGQPLAPAFAAAYDFLNSPRFLGFVHALTGDGRGVYVDAQATRFLPGHYLNQHDDKKPEAGRLYAYVLNLTRVWRTDWGGLLNFIDDDGHVAEGYQPAWNALNLFRVPQSHAVACVAPFAAAPRLSITGWVRSARPAKSARPPLNNEARD